MEIKGNVIFAFSEENGNYHIIYDEVRDKGPGFSRTVGAAFKLMHEYPELVEEYLQAALKCAEEMSMPFNNILNDNERP